MNKIEERSCWSLKEIEEVQRNLCQQRIDRKRVDIVPCCSACGTRHGKNERLVVTANGKFCCLPKFSVQGGRTGLTAEDIEAGLEPYAYGQAVYPLVRYCADPALSKRVSRVA